MEVLSQKQPMKPSELAKQLNLTRSNIYRLLVTLQEMGYVERAADATHSLTMKMFMVGSAVLDMKEVSKVARPYIAHLAEISQECAHLGIMYDNKVLYIEQVKIKHYLTLDYPVGQTDQLYCTALGKVLLTGLNEVQLEAWVRSTNLVRYTENTITDPDVLLGVIRNVKKQDYAIDNEERYAGIKCVGTPIYDYTNKIVAAISISGPAVRLTNEKIEELKPLLIEVSEEISRKMGWSNFGM